MNAEEAEARLRAWRKNHDTPAKVVAAHKKALLERVSHPMAFDSQPISVDRLRTLTSAITDAKHETRST
jgi:hypothetical protein